MRFVRRDVPVWIIVALLAELSQHAAFGQTATVTFTIKGLDGTKLTTSELNKNRALRKQLPLSDAEFKEAMQVFVTPQSGKAAATFDFVPSSAQMRLTFSQLDPKNLRTDVQIVVPGILESVLVRGLAMEDGSVNVVMPLSRAYRPRRCSCW